MTDTSLTAELAQPFVLADGGPDQPLDGRQPLLTLADLRFFAICYLAGLIFFLVMLS